MKTDNILLIIFIITSVFVIFKFFILLIGKYLFHNLEKLPLDMKFNLWITNRKEIEKIFVEKKTYIKRDELLFYFNNLERIVNSLNDSEIELLLYLDFSTFKINYNDFIIRSVEFPFQQVTQLRIKLYNI